MKHKSRAKQAGVALIAALILMTSIVLVLGNIFYRHQINVAQASLSMHQDQAFLLALSAESWARQLLDEDDRKFDHFDEIWAQAIPAMPVDGGLINGCISDLQSRFNINSLLTYKNYTELVSAISGDKSSFAKVWTNLLRNQEIPYDADRLATVIDWLDANSSTMGSNGAERDIYEGLMPPQMIADSPMVQTSELASVIGYRVAEVQRLMPLMSALPVLQNEKPNDNNIININLNTASNELLMALGGDVDTMFTEAITANRPLETIEEFYEILAFDLGFTMPDIENRWPRELVGVASQFFELYIEVMLGEARIEVRSIIMRSSNKDSVIISRDLTTVPASVEKDSASGFLDKLTQGADSDKDSDMIDEQQVLPACIMIGA
ncbi:MAG: type II secretion system minor pseudopilin GspK [Porticoccaceae bacterium]